MLRARTAAWENPEASIGRYITVIGSKKAWEATGPAAEIFENELSGIINRLLQAHKEDLQSGEEIASAVSFHLWIVGRKTHTAKPTIIFTGKSSAYRKRAIQLLEKHNILADFPGMALKSMDKMPAQPMGKGCNQMGQQIHRDVLELEEKIVYVRAGCTKAYGSSIFVGNNHEATLGGTLLINGIYYGLTSLHPRKGRNSSLESLIGVNGKLAFDDDSDTTSTRTNSLRSIYPSSRNLSFHRSSVDLSSPSGTTGDEGKNEQLPSYTETSNANLHRIGAVIEGNSRKELDYDIFPIEDPSLHLANRIPLPRAQGQQQEFLSTAKIATKVIESEVWIATGKSGIIKGTLINNPYFIKMAGSESYQKMWPVQLETNIVPGDCGSWVVDAQSGDLYGHIVAGDASLRRAYIISASDVMDDITATFENDATLPNISSSISNYESLFPSVEPSRGPDLDEPRAANDLLPAAVKLQNFDHFGTTAAAGYQTVGSSCPSDYYAKVWDPIFSKNRVFYDEPWKERLRSMFSTDAYDEENSDDDEDDSDNDDNDDDNNDDNENDNKDDDDFGIFPRDSGDSGDFSIYQEVEMFCQDACLHNLESGADLAGQRRVAWLDDTSLYGVTSGRTRSECNRKYQIPLTATGLYRHLKVPRFKNADEPDADRRLIYIPNLDPYYILALGETASSIEARGLRDAVSKYLTLQTSIRVDIPHTGFLFFQLDLHLPYFALRTSPPLKDPKVGNIYPPRQWTDLSFLDVQPPKSQAHRSYGIYEAQTSFHICGTGDRRWIAYAFVDTFFKENGSKEDFRYDPIALSRPDARFPVFDPREYFLRIFDIRIAQVSYEWESLVRMVERAVTRSSIPQLILVQDAGMRAEEVQKTFDWIQKTIELLSKLSNLLSETIKEWERFISHNGDVGYFYDYASSPNASQRNRSAQSLACIKKRYDDLERLQRKLTFLETNCRDSSQALQLRLMRERNEVAIHNKETIKLTILILSPFALAMAYFSVPQTVIPFELTSRSFVVTILVIMGAIWVLVFMQGFWSRRPLQEISKWVNIHPLTERALVCGNKLGLRRRRAEHGRTINSVEVEIDVV